MAVATSPESQLNPQHVAEQAAAIAQRTLVTLATYNEMENLPDLVADILEEAPQVDVLVIDDASPDGTGRWVDQRAQHEPRLRALHRSGKLGLGTATVAGMCYAIEHGYEYMLSMDADYSHHPRYLSAILAGMEPLGEKPVDVMIGSRYVAGGGIEGWPLKRHVMSRGVNFLARTCLGLRPRDCSGGFRCYRTSALEQIDFSQIRSHGYAFLEEVLWRLHRSGARMDETPIVFVDRVRGHSKIDWREALSALWVMGRLGVKHWLGV